MQETVMEENKQAALARTFVEQTGVSVLLMGKAGTGKTTFLRNLYNRQMKRMVILAPTGVAALNAGGVTIHSFFQLPLSPFVPDSKFRRDSANAKYRFQFSREKLAMIRSIDLLVIDEISMVRADLLDAVDQVLRRYRQHNKPFGGVQLLLIGDLAQLSPVVTEQDSIILREYYDTPYFYGSKALRQVPYVSIELTHIYRQRDKDFLAILNEIRAGMLSDESLARLSQRYIPDFVPARDGEGYIRLTTHNRQADSYNQKRLADLTGDDYCYEAKITGNFPEQLYPIDKELHLREGAQVMFCKNDSTKQGRYYNGKLATVVELDENSIMVQCIEDDLIVEVTRDEWENSKYSLDATTHEIVEEIEGRFVQYPLRLAWAITIHKSQGLTFDRCVIDAIRSFSPGQVYVALSRCRTLEGIVLSSPLTRQCIITDESVKSYITAQENASSLATPHLEDYRKSYYTSLIDELFDYTSIRQYLERYYRLMLDSYAKKYPAHLSGVKVAYDDMQEKLADVASAFKKQYTAMVNVSPDYQADERIQERLKKGSAYFLDTTRNLFETIIKSPKPQIGNKAVQERMDTAHADLTNELRIKTKTLAAISDKGFTVKDYLNVKAKASVSDSDIPKPKPRKKKK
ncbi:MAG: AAA family ATPase [Bacteroidaceae bacterium]|nr:AAA family ATPase [Bacteroidaceae bacterium]